MPPMPSLPNREERLKIAQARVDLSHARQRAGPRRTPSPSAEAGDRARDPRQRAAHATGDDIAHSACARAASGPASGTGPG
jgi:hypothetical protein